MRPSSIFRGLALPLLAIASTVPGPGPAPVKQSVGDVAIRQIMQRDGSTASLKPGTEPSTDTVEPVGKSTTFNGKRVPPMIELDGEHFNQTIKDGYWFVEFFSPYCHHCLAFAPVWQTLYEFYHSMEPLPQTSGSGESHNDLNSFTRFYDFKFARLDCVAYGDACNEQEIVSFPTIAIYKNGKKVETKVGGRNLAAMSKWVEQLLETIKPGSRPQNGPQLPQVGAKSAPPPPSFPASATSWSTALATETSERPRKATPSPAGKVTTIQAGKVTPNSLGKSTILNAESFQRLVTNTREPWFIKFYAPWCPHCQAMAPNWQGMARQMEGKLNIGEVNCEAEKRLCKDAKARSYPTILFFQGGEHIEYDGLRGLGDLISFANKALTVKDGIPDVTAAQFEALEEKEDVIFLYVYDDATTSEDFAALDRLVLSLIGHAKLVKARDPALAQRYKISTWPRLLVSRNGKPSYYNGLSPREMRDCRRVLHWMKSVWLPIVPELTVSNAHEVMDGRLVVLAILSRNRPDEFAMAQREIKNAALEWIDKQTQAFQLERQELRDAKQLRIEEAEDRNDQRALRAAKSIRINMDEIERKEVGFAWVDGVFWERWVKTTFGLSVADGEKVVVYDEDNYRYWDVTMTGNPIVPSRTSILETLPRIVANPPKISPKSTTNALGHLWWVIRGQLLGHPFVSGGLVMAIVLTTLVYGKKYGWNQGGYIRLGEKNGMNGVLGGNAGSGQGKVD